MPKAATTVLSRRSFLARRFGPRLRVFISYRRADSAGHAGRLRDALVEEFGRDAVFFDINVITPGESFSTLIMEALTSSDVVLAVIGRQWLTVSGEDGRRRLDDPDDLVRREIAAAFGEGLRVIPLLVQGAEAPRESELPDELARLAQLHAFELSDRRWEQDIAQLTKILHGLHHGVAYRPFVERALDAARSFLRTRLGKAAAAAALAACVVAAAQALFPHPVWYRLRRDFEGCVRWHAPGSPGAVAEVRAGASDTPVVRADEYPRVLERRHEQDGVPLVLRLSDSGHDLGVVFLNFFKADDVSRSMFQVKKIIEPPCNDVQDYHNDGQPAADKNLLKNWDKLRVRLGGREYLLRPGDDKGYVVATLSAAPQQ